jgi:parallel beta-helix repeat protein
MPFMRARSTDNHVSGNRFVSGGGISIVRSRDNVLRDNSMEGKGPNFSVECETAESASDFVNDVDESNTINGKEVCYWINQHNRTVSSNAGYVALVNCSGVIAENLNLANNGEGVLLISTMNSQILNNSIMGNNKGLVIHKSEDNSFISNSILNCTYGILSHSTRNSFKNNSLENCTYDVNFEDRFIGEFNSSNIVDGAPVCYWSWKSDRVVPTNVGYVVLIGCSNITIQNLNITRRRQGMLLLELTDSVISKNVLVNNGEGIILKGSSNNQIAGNLMENNSKAVYFEASHSNNVSGNRVVFSSDVALHFEDSNGNTVSGNYIAHSGQGFILNRGSDSLVAGNSIMYSNEKAVHLGESTDNTLTGNNIAWSKGWAITVSGSVGNNQIHHNDFVNNLGGTFQAYPGSKTHNLWDDGSEGNFWSDYWRLYPTAQEMEGTNMMDTALELNEVNVDRYPLTKPVDIKYQVTLLNPENKSYESGTLPLVFFSTAPECWMGYCLDNQETVTAQDDAVLSGLSEGTHRLTVYAGQNENGVCAYETVYFTVKGAETAVPEPAEEESPEQSTPEPEPSASPQAETEPAEASGATPLTTDAVILAAVAVACIIVAVIFLARRKRF